MSVLRYMLIFVKSNLNHIWLRNVTTIEVRIMDHRRADNMVFQRVLTAVTALVLMAGTAYATTEGRYKSAEIRQGIIGKRIFLATPMGGEFPLNYRKNGVVDGDGEALGLGRFVKPNDTGKWWIKDDQLCQRFTTWYKGAPMCFELYKTGDKSLNWIRDNGQKGTARIGQSL